MNDTRSRVVAMMVVSEGAHLYDEHATTISLDDEVAGEFIKLHQCHERAEAGVVSFDFEEWDAIDRTVREMIKHSKEWYERKDSKESA